MGVVLRTSTFATQTVALYVPCVSAKANRRKMDYGFDSQVVLLHKKIVVLPKGKTTIIGGDDGSRTHVRKSIPETFYERSLSFVIPLKRRR